MGQLAKPGITHGTILSCAIYILFTRILGEVYMSKTLYFY